MNFIFVGFCVNILQFMEIKYLGWQSFRLQEGKTSLITQPYSQKETGVLFPKVKADIVLQIFPGKKAGDRITPSGRKEVFWLFGPGEYEIGGVDIRGIPGAYWFRMRQFEIVFLWQWDLKGIKKLADSLPTIDLLLIKGKGEENGFAKKIKSAVEAISPSITIPFCSPTVKKEDLKENKWAKSFLDALDREDVKAKEKLVLDKEEIAGEDLKVFLLQPRL